MLYNNNIQSGVVMDIISVFLSNTLTVTIKIQAEMLNQPTKLFSGVVKQWGRFIWCHEH